MVTSDREVPIRKTSRLERKPDDYRSPPFGVKFSRERGCVVMSSLMERSRLRIESFEDSIALSRIISAHVTHQEAPISSLIIMFLKEENRLMTPPKTIITAALYTQPRSQRVSCTQYTGSGPSYSGSRKYSITMLKSLGSSNKPSLSEYAYGPHSQKCPT